MSYTTAWGECSCYSLILIFSVVCVPSGSPLTVNLLLEAVSNVTDWHGIGRRLGLTMSQLRRIEITFHIHGVERIKAEMFDVWLKSSPNASWTDLITALEAMGIDNDIAAANTSGNVMRS